MEQRLVWLLQSCLHPNQLKQLHALVLTRYSNLTPLFLSRMLRPSTIRYAGKVFEAISEPDSDLCNSFISTCCKLSLHREALEAFFLAHRRRTEITFYSFPPALKACAALAAAGEGKQLHSLALTYGFSSNVFIQTALIDFYAKTDDLDSAERVFHEIAVKEPVPCNCLISGYSKAGRVSEARTLFDQMKERTAASWNAMVSCYAHQGNVAEALRLFEQMQNENARPNEVTFVTLLSICAKLGDLNAGMKIKKLVDDYNFCTNLIVRTALLEMYVKCGAVNEARLEFDQMEHRDVVAWGTMITGYAQNGRSNEALELFEKMKLERCKPNDVTLVGVLSACAQLGSMELGENIGSYVEGQGFASSVYVASALLDMYAKCGNIRRARRVFDQMDRRDIVSWNSMIGGLAVNGHAKDAIDLFQQMMEEKYKPNDITFVGLLTACTHAGLVDLGLTFFDSMKQDHDIVPKVEHCACIVDLLCKAGRLEDSYQFICRMEVEPSVVIWGTLLSACRARSNVELAERAMERLLVLEPDSSSNYVLLSNIYADAGRWEEARKVRVLMRNKNVRKLAGYSWIELDSVVHRFLVGDTYHIRSDEIYDVVDGLGLHVKWFGYAPDLDLELL